MKNLFISVILVFVISTLCFAQNKPNYSGSWIIDISRSKITTQTPITKSIEQSDDEIRILNDAAVAQILKTPANPIVYTLNWHENSKEFENEKGKTFISYQSGLNKNNNFEVVQKQRKDNSAEELSLIETWKLEDEGKTLRIKYSYINSNGEQTSEIAFTKELVNPKEKSSKSFVNGKAQRLVTPPYPPEAKKARADGAVYVQVLIDEKDGVVLAKAIFGHPTLLKVAEAAAMLCKFSKTKINETPVKVSGVIEYNFSRP